MTYNDFSWDESIGANTKGGPNTGFILPVELAYFRGKANEGQVLLTWATHSETNNEGFEIEKSLDGVHFQYIGYVEGNGDSDRLITYEFEDLEVNELAFYRLKQYDFDGQFEYHPVIRVSAQSNSGDLLVYPNPLSQQTKVSISGQNEIFRAALISANGYVLFEDPECTVEKLEYFLQKTVASMDPGIYLLRYNFGTREELQRLIR